MHKFIIQYLFIYIFRFSCWYIADTEPHCYATLNGRGYSFFSSVCGICRWTHFSACGKRKVYAKLEVIESRLSRETGACSIAKKIAFVISTQSRFKHNNFFFARFVQVEGWWLLVASFKLKVNDSNEFIIIESLMAIYSMH